MKYIYIGKKIKISTAAAIFAVLLLYLSDKAVILASAIAMLSHELSHIISIRFCGERVSSVTVYMTGADISCTDILPFKHRLAILSSGICINAILGTLSLKYGTNDTVIMLGEYSLLYGAFNCLPIKSLDGGRILHTVLSYFSDESSCERILSIISFCILLTAYQCGIYIFYKTEGNFSILFACMFLFYDDYCENAIKKQRI